MKPYHFNRTLGAHKASSKYCQTSYCQATRAMRAKRVVTVPLQPYFGFQIRNVHLVAHDCGYPLSRYTCRATRVAADFLDFIAFCRCEIFLGICSIWGAICQVYVLDVVDPAWVDLLFMQDLSGDRSFSRFARPFRLLVFGAFAHGPFLQRE